MYHPQPWECLPSKQYSGSHGLGDRSAGFKNNINNNKLL
jgi:hypothetical protein